jgi:tetratricopeptide (TPR) repeat protein
LTSRIVVLFLAIAAQLPCAYGGPLDRAWYEYRSAHFVVVSDQDEARVAAAIDALELFRAFVFKVTNARAGNEIVPVDFYLFGNRGDFLDTIKMPNVLGYMRSGLRIQYMVAGDGVIGLDSQHVVFHEYVHYLLRNGGTSALHPKWYDEGLAEMLAATRFRSEQNKVVLGADIPERIADLRAGIHVALSEIVATNDLTDWHPYRVSIFYSKSFALVNYLHVSRLVGNDRYPQMNEYLRLYREGVDSTAAFEQAFGMPVSAMERELGQFLSRSQRPVLELPMDRFPRDGTYTRRAVPPQEIAYRMGYLMLNRNPSGARKLFEADGRAHSDARFRAGVAVSYQFEEKFDDALETMNAALASAPNDPVVLQEAADLRAIWCRSEKPPSHCSEFRAEARNEYEMLLAIEPERLEAEAAFGALLNDLGAPADAATHLERVYARAPWYVPAIAELGIAREGTGDADGAVPLLRRAMAWTESDAALSERIQKALDRAQKTATAAPDGKSGVGAAAMPSH